MPHHLIKEAVLSVLIFAGFMAMTAAHAEMNDRDAVRDVRGRIVRDTAGHCVRTKWISADGTCPSVMLQAVRQQVVRQARTAIMQEDRTIYFQFDKADLSVAAKERLNTLAHTLKSARDIQEARIVGYADRMGSVSYNDRLSQKRAEAVRDYLIAQGYTSVRNTKTRWLGESAPVTGCSPVLPRTELIECLQHDRRVEVEIGYRREEQVSQASETIPSP